MHCGHRALVIAYATAAMSFAGCGGDELAGDGGPPAAAGPTYEAGALFMCGSCKCDGRVAFCVKYRGGPAWVPEGGTPGQPGGYDWSDGVNGDLCPLLDASDGVGCLPYGGSCAPSPSCACVNSPICAPSDLLYPGCFVRDAGVGFELRCYDP